MSESKGSDQDDAIRQWTLKCVALSEQNERMAGMLRELEWSDTGERGFSDSDKPDTRCPVCHEYGYDGHASDCRLDALLRSLP